MCIHQLSSFLLEFRRRYLNLLGRQFRSFPPALALGLFMSHDWKPGSKVSGGAEREQLSHDVMAGLFSKIDLQLLEQYTRNMADYHTITYLLPESELACIPQSLCKCEIFFPFMQWLNCTLLIG